jgi:hypothetical protein
MGNGEWGMGKKEEGRGKKEGRGKRENAIIVRVSVTKNVLTTLAVAIILADSGLTHGLRNAAILAVSLPPRWRLYGDFA